MWGWVKTLCCIRKQVGKVMLKLLYSPSITWDFVVESDASQSQSQMVAFVGPESPTYHFTIGTGRQCKGGTEEMSWRFNLHPKGNGRKEATVKRKTRRLPFPFDLYANPIYRQEKIITNFLVFVSAPSLFAVKKGLIDLFATSIMTFLLEKKHSHLLQVDVLDISFGNALNDLYGLVIHRWVNHLVILTNNIV